MDETSEQPLAQCFAGLSAELHAMAEHHAAQNGLVSALHALFLTLLALMLAHLAVLAERWQAGLLQPRTPSRRPRIARAARRPAHGKARPITRHPSARQPALAAAPCPLPAVPHPHGSAARMPPRARPGRAAPHPCARLIPLWPRSSSARPPFLQKSPLAPPHIRAAAVPA